jgi:hypothetical protein
MRASVSGAGVPDAPGEPIFLIKDDRNDGIIRTTMLPEAAHAVLLRYSYLSLRTTMPYFRGSIFGQGTELSLNNLTQGWVWKDKEAKGRPIVPMAPDLFNYDWQNFRTQVFEEVSQYEHLFQTLTMGSKIWTSTTLSMINRFPDVVVRELNACDPDNNQYSENFKIYASYQSCDIRTAYDELARDIDFDNKIKMKTLGIWNQIVEKSLDCEKEQDWLNLRIYLRLMLLNGGGTFDE